MSNANGAERGDVARDRTHCEQHVACGFTGIAAGMLVVTISIGGLGPKTNGVRLEDLVH